MIINTNIASLNTLGALTKNTAATQKSIQKLSTGLRINSASDDAAGLAISEKMRGQISGLQQGSANAQDGISMLQTAEGGLDQTHSILQRMRELAVQSANDTNTSDDRQKIQGEVDQLAKEISRISNTTQFNTQNLLAGGMSDTLQIGANANQNMAVSVSAMDAQSLGVAGNYITAASAATISTGVGANLNSVSRSLTGGSQYTVKVVSNTVAAYSTNINQTYKNIGSAETMTIAAITAYTGTTDANYLVKVASVNTAGTAVTSIAYSTDNGTSWTTQNGTFTAGVKINGMAITFAAASANVGDTFAFGVKAASTTLQLMSGTANVGASVTVHKGDTTATIGDSSVDQTVNLQFTYSSLKATAATGGFKAKSVASTAAVLNNANVAQNAYVAAGINVSTQANANNAITTIDNAINAVSKQRSALGAYENRLTNTIDNLNTSNENTTAAESRIRDVDMSSEMMNYQKNNILQQAATAMLAKANQQPQSVLQLLQG